MIDWITDRLPTADDADEDGNVCVRNRPEAVPWCAYFHWSMVLPGMAWCHTDTWEAPAKPALAVGQRWRRRDGAMVTIEHYNPNVSTTCPFGADGFVYAPDGTAPGAPDADLVELIEPAAEPAAEPEPVTTPRRFVSISRTVWLDQGGIQYDYIDAVADDGTAWWMGPDETEWQQAPALPAREVPRF
jgi:hypothetical protein